MPWGEIDDKAHGHWKFAEVGKAATGVYFLGLSWARDHLKQRGVIPEATARRTLGADDEDIAALTGRAQLWEPIDGGYLIHDYRPRYEAEDAKRSEKARVAAETRWQGRHSDSPSMLGESQGMPVAPTAEPPECSEHAHRMPRARDTNTNTKEVSVVPSGTTSSAEPSDAHAEKPTRVPIAAMVEGYNANRGPLPSVVAAGKREAGLRATWPAILAAQRKSGSTDPPLDVWHRMVRAAAADRFYAENRCDLGTIIAKRDRWIDAALRVPSPNGNGHHPPVPILTPEEIDAQRAAYDPTGASW